MIIEETIVPTPADPETFAAEYVRIARKPDGEGYQITRKHAVGLRRGKVDVIAETCGGSLGLIIAYEAARMTNKVGMIGTIYVDEGIDLSRVKV